MKAIIDEKRLVLDFIMNSGFSKAANPPKHIFKQYVRRTKSTIQVEDFIRIIKQLLDEKYLEKSTGPHGEDCYSLTHNSFFVDEIEEEEKLKFLKLKYDVKNAERVYKSYWWTFGIAAAAFIISFILLILRLIGK